jgi:hypothetical protein
MRFLSLQITTNNMADGGRGGTETEGFYDITPRGTFSEFLNQIEH